MHNDIYINQQTYYHFRFLHINCRFGGASRDAYILNASTVPQLVGNIQGGGYLLGDSGYPLKQWLLTPLANPQSQAERSYNGPLLNKKLHRKGIWGTEVTV